MPRAFDVMILHLSQDDKLSACGLWMFQISTLANCETEVYELLKLSDSSGDKHDEKISNCSSTPKLVQAHDSAVSLMIF